ncbi:hypothetical protein [Streptomyces sp. CRN 30]|uniref:hypothetical protein n=1 Tax=Streptomyces sp. CRN 30 TaxID=3075613 RepID=UPI002A8318FE|nr:hypothetical protein [Streptomyces sp. CRN 30]
MTSGTLAHHAIPLATIMSLDVRTWVDRRDARGPLPSVMLTHGAPRDFTDSAPAAIEAAMRRVVHSFGAGPAGAEAPDIGVRFTVHDAHALLWFPQSLFALKLRRSPWVRALDEAGCAHIAIGIDELSSGASVAEVDEYRERATELGRLHLALAYVGRPPGGPS